METKNRIFEYSASDNNRNIHKNTSQCEGTPGAGPLPPSRGQILSAGCLIAIAAGFAAVGGVASADSLLQQVGVMQLQQLVPQLNGSGMGVQQVEASVSTTSDQYQPNPANLGRSASEFTFTDFTGSNVPFSSASYSWHAENVAGYFYGAGGVAPGVSHVTVSFVDTYAEFSVFVDAAPPANSEVVNQSFAYVSEDLANVQYIDNAWDNYAASSNLLFVTAIGDGQTTSTSPASYINPPADMYNGIAVGAYTGTETNGVFGPSTGSEASWVGPTWDGRSKPDLVAPGQWTSYTAPIVSGVATLMVQAGSGTHLSAPVGLSASDSSIANGSVTAYTTAATDIRTVKALLLNGAVKPTGWTNSYTVNSGTYTYNAVNANAVTPLDPRYGAGVVNAYNSYENLAGGEHNFTSSTMQSIAALPSVTSAPTANFTGTFSQAASATNPATITGWNLASISASSTGNAVENYDFNLTGTSINSWDLTATLTWNKNYNASGINHLMLFLLNSSGQRVASSTSMLDNVQQININPALGINSLAPGQYDLAVEMLGGVNTISTSDTYALAWNFVDPTTVPEPTALAIFALGLSLLAMPKKRPAGIGGQ